jgi:cytochrome c oxidase cbb3-type subunit III
MPVPPLILRLSCLIVGAFMLAASRADEPELYTQHCASCHGPAGQAAPSIPDLSDGVWKYGGSLVEIENSISYGRRSTMPALGMPLDVNGGTDATGLDQVVAYVLSLSGSDAASKEQLAAGAALFMMFCASCHGENGQGTPSMGAPDLTDDAWSYGGDVKSIRDVIVNGRASKMPAFSDTLSATQIRVLGELIQRMAEQE